MLPGCKVGMRVFVAVELTADMQEELRVLQETLRAALEPTRARLTWVRPGLLHLTLRFFADVRAQQVAQLLRIVQHIGTACQPLTLQLAEVGMFPLTGPPRVIWVGVRQGQEAVYALASRLNQALDQHAFPPDDRPFHPHVTLGRVTSVARHAPFRCVLEAASFQTTTRVSVDHVVLFESSLTPQGPCYTPLLSTTPRTQP